MNPGQIDVVADTWLAARRDRAALLDALSERLPGDADDRRWRAAWIVEAVTLLAPLIDRPTHFVASAIDLLVRRGAVTMAELGEDQTALLGALDERLGRLDDESRRAWSLALKLFEETIAAQCLDPFRSCTDERDVAARTRGTIGAVDAIVPIEERR